MTKRTLFKDLKVGQPLSIDGGRIVITLEEKSGHRARIRFTVDGVNIDLPADQPAPRARRSGAAIAMLGTKIE